MFFKAIENTSCDVFASIATFSSSSSKATIRNDNIPIVDIGGKSSKIDKEIAIYFDDNKHLILDKRKANIRNITLLNHLPHSYSKDAYKVYG